MTDIVDFIHDLSFEDIPDRGLEVARLCLLDAVGCMIGGIQSPEVYNLAKTISTQNPGSTPILGTDLSSTKSWAAFINSHACTYFDLDDGHRKAQGHPGGVVIPLSLMFARENRCTGKELLAAIVAGYETAVRSALIMRQAGGPRKGSGGWSITGGVAAAAKLSKLSKVHVKSALGLAEYYAPQAPQDRSLAFPSSMKEGMAWASHSAINIVQLAASGFDAMSPFLRDFGHGDDLGVNWEIESVYFKIYACCRFSHPVLDGLMDLTRKHKISYTEIKSIKVISFAKALLLNHMTPGHPVAAMYSIPFIIGCFLVKGKVGPEEMGADALNDPQILQTAQKVEIEEDPAITNQFPEKCLARISLTLKNGDIIHSETLSAKGDPDNPFSYEQMKDKFFNLVTPLYGEKTEVMYNTIMRIDDARPTVLWDTLNAVTEYS